jgi:hypothetical protein
MLQATETTRETGIFVRLVHEGLLIVSEHRISQQWRDFLSAGKVSASMNTTGGR